MSLRLLFGILAPGPPDQQNDYNKSSEFEIMPQDKDMCAMIQINDIQDAAKFHIGMLSISLIIGLAFGGFTIWWMEKKPFLSYVINLLIALICRTFFSILFDGVILLGSGNVAGGNALLAFEQIFINLVLAFWLSLTIYLHARVQRNFKSEPTLNLYRYGVPGVAVFFAFIWIFLLQAEFPSALWWLILHPSTQWVVNSFNLLCILIQLALVGDIARIMQKTSFDNDSTSLFKKVAILMGVLVFIFWLQFGLYIGRLPLRNSSSYTYFFYFVDGIECASVCLILYFFNNWVEMLSDPDSELFGTEVNPTASSNEELLVGSGGRGIVTLDSVFMTNESGKLRNSEDEGIQDVVYSNVVDPQKWEKILDLYKRLNHIPSRQENVVEGDEFYDCPLQTDREISNRTQRSISDESSKRVSSEDRYMYKNDKRCDQIQKKTAFYSSKYLVLDSKCEVPKYLETRPSLSSMSGRGIPKEGGMSKDDSPSINSVKTEELVQKWLSDNSNASHLNCASTETIKSEAKIENKLTESLDQSDKPPNALVRYFPDWEKFEEVTPVSKAQIKEQKNYEPKQSDSEDSKAKSTYLNQYLTNSELQERRMSREKRASDQRCQASKSIFSLPETLSSMMDYFVNGRGSLLGQRTDPKLSNDENLMKYVPHSHVERQSGKLEMKDKTQFEEQMNKPTTVSSEATGEEERFLMRKISISSGSEFSIERIYEEHPRQELGISISGNLTKSVAMKETDTSSNCTIESRKNSSSGSSSGSFSIENYYQLLHNAKLKREQKK